MMTSLQRTRHRKLVSRFEGRALLGMVLVGLLLWSFGCDRHSRSSVRLVGDATLVDHGWNAYRPRFEILFTPVRLGEATRIRFHLARLPKAELALELREAIHGKEGFSHKEYLSLHDSLEMAEAKLAVILTANGGEVIAAFEGGIGDWGGGGADSYSVIQTPKLRGLTLDSYPSLELEIRFESNGTVDLSHVSLHPRLVGGGGEAM